AVSPRLCRRRRGGAAPDPATEPLVGSLTLAELRGYVADRNPDRKRFPNQDRAVTPLARAFARQYGIDPYTPPTLEELFQLARQHAHPVVLDLELKRVPSRPEFIGDDFDGEVAGPLEKRVVDLVWAAGLGERARVRSFDHRSVRAVRRYKNDMTTAVLIAE